MRSLRIPNYVNIIGIILSMLLLVWIPYNVIQAVASKSLDPLFGGITIVLSIIAGGVLAFFSIVFGFASPFVPQEDSYSREIKEKLRMYRARQRAMLEELDEIKKLLEEIRDLLKEGMAV